MRTNIHLSFNGNCQKAMEFYKALFDAPITLMLSYGASPSAESTPEEWRDKIIHSTLSLNNIEISGTDVQSPHYRKPQGFSILFEVSSQTHAQKIYDTLAKGGAVQFALQKTFWSPAYGLVTDRFGIPWEINCVSI